MAQYLYIRQGMYYFRIRIPTHQRQHLSGKQEIRKSLGTYNRQVALALSARMLAAMKDRITDDDIESLHKVILDRDQRLQEYLDPKLKLINIKKGDAEIEIDYGGDIEKEQAAAQAIL